MSLMSLLLSDRNGGRLPEVGTLGTKATLGTLETGTELLTKQHWAEA